MAFVIGSTFLFREQGKSPLKTLVIWFLKKCIFIRVIILNCYMMLLAKSTPAGVERDAFLWREMREGNECAFQEVFDTYCALLFQYGLTITKDRELVKDCVQELFITMWTTRQNLGIAKSVKYYMFFSLRRLIIKKLRKTKNLFSLSSLSNASLIVDGQDQVMLRNETNVNNQLLVSAALQTLPARQKEIIFLKYYQELRYEEIEKIMNLNNQVVRNTLCKALNNLRRQIGKRQLHAVCVFLLTMFIEYFLSYY
jgi:RNA polymerase sigma factor (sigma-70 family)